MTTFDPVVGDDDDLVAQGEGVVSVTYGALRAAAHGVAAALRDIEGAEGLESGDVLLLCEDRYWFAVGLLGAWQAGRRVTLPPHRGQGVLEELRRRHLVLHDGHVAGGRTLDVTRVPPGAPRALDVIAAEQELLTLYTSGSTGQPRAWVKRARQVLGEAAVLGRQLRIEPGDRVLPTVAPQHIYGLLFGVLLPLAVGASFERSTPLHAEAILGCAVRGRARWLVSVPAHLAVLQRLLRTRSETGSTAADAALGDVADGPGWAVHSVVSSGAPLSEAIALGLRTFGLDVVDVLGSTETGGVGLRRTGVEETWTPLEGVRVRVDAGGQLLVRSSFLEDPQSDHVAGDRGTVEADGRFRHLGRTDDVAKVGGKRVSLGEVEAEVRRISGVLDAVALRQEVGGLRGEEIWLVVVAPGCRSQELRAALRGRLDAVLVPRRIRVVTELPRDERGKVQRGRLLSLFDAQPSPAGPDLLKLSVEPERATAELRVPGGWDRFEGHFPADPLLPAVSQLSDLVLPCVRSAWADLGRLTRVNRLKFLSPLRPGSSVTVALERSLAKVGFELRGPERVVARGTLWFEAANGIPEDPADVR